MKRIKKWFKSPVHVMGMLVLIAVLGMATIAYFTDVEAAINSINIGNINTDVDEDITEPVTKKNITVTNNGHSAAYIRIRVDIPSVSYDYTDEKGVVQSGQQAVITLPDGQTLSFEEWQGLDGFSYGEYTWTKIDGYWYLEQPLPAGEDRPSVVFLQQITFPGLYLNGELNLPDGMTTDMFTIPIVSESVQEIAGVTDTEGKGMAYATFRYVAQNANDSDG